MGNLSLKFVGHSRFHHPVNPTAVPLEGVFASLAATVARNINQAMQSCGDLDADGATLPHLLTSTIVNMCFTVGDFSWSRFRSMIAARTSAPPTSLLSAYECAGWGYSLRYLFKHCSGARYFLVTILDVNLYDFEFWLYNSNWGKSGFGCTTLLFEKNGPIGDELIVGAVRGNNALMEFAFSVNRVARGAERAIVALPCFPERVFDTLAHALASLKVLPNGHNEWGHCFGSDPWLGILKSQMSGGGGSRFIACSLALNGYFCIVKVDIHPDISIASFDAPPEEVANSGGVAAIELQRPPELASITPFEEYEGILERRPFGDKAILAQTQSLPLIGEHDFAVVSSFAGSRDTPVLLNYSEHCDFLELLVRNVLIQIPDLDIIVVRMRMPFQGRIPIELLNEKVLLLDEQVEGWGGHGAKDVDMVEIEDGFLRHPLELGDNHIKLRVTMRKPGHRLHDLIPWLQSVGIREIGNGSKKFTFGRA